MPDSIPFLDRLAQTNMGFSSFVTNFPPNVQLTAKFGLITDTDDPLDLGRARVTFDNENYEFETSEWVYCLNHPGGKLSTDFIGQKCVIIYESGDPNNAIILGLIPTNNRTPLGNPLKLPVLKSEASSEFGQIPECNEANSGSILVFNEYSGTNPRICRRGETGEYAWQNLNTPQVYRSNLVEVESPAQKVSDPIGQYIPGEIFVRKTCEVDQFVPFISDYNKDGVPRYRQLVSAPVYTRSTLADCNNENLGSLALIKDAENTYPAICGIKEGKFRWLDISPGRTVVKFSEPFADNGNVDDFVLNKTQGCLKPVELEDTERDKVQRKTDAEISLVPDIDDQNNLTRYIQTEAFQNIIRDLTEVRDTDQGAKDRAQLLRNQLYTVAWQITDNNITLIEDVLKRRIDDHVDTLLPALQEMADTIENLAGIVRSLANTSGISNDPGRGLAARNAVAPIEPRVRVPLFTRVRPGLASSESAVREIETGTLDTVLQPGATLNRYDTRNSENKITTNDLELDRAIEIEDAEGAQIGSIPYNALKEANENGNKSISTFLNSLSKAPEALSKIRNVAFRSFTDILPEEVANQIEQLVSFSDIEDVLKEAVLSFTAPDLLAPLSGFLSYNNTTKKLEPGERLNEIRALAGADAADLNDLANDINESFEEFNILQRAEDVLNDLERAGISQNTLDRVRDVQLAVDADNAQADGARLNNFLVYFANHPENRSIVTGSTEDLEKALELLTPEGKVLVTSERERNILSYFIGVNIPYPSALIPSRPTTSRGNQRRSFNQETAIAKREYSLEFIIEETLDFIDDPSSRLSLEEENKFVARSVLNTLADHVTENRLTVNNKVLEQLAKGRNINVSDSFFLRISTELTPEERAVLENQLSTILAGRSFKGVFEFSSTFGRVLGIPTTVQRSVDLVDNFVDESGNLVINNRNILEAIDTIGLELPPIIIQILRLSPGQRANVINGLRTAITGLEQGSIKPVITFISDNITLLGLPNSARPVLNLLDTLIQEDNTIDLSFQNVALFFDVAGIDIPYGQEVLGILDQNTDALGSLLVDLFFDPSNNSGNYIQLIDLFLRSDSDAIPWIETTTREILSQDIAGFNVKEVLRSFRKRLRNRKKNFILSS